MKAHFLAASVLFLLSTAAVTIAQEAAPFTAREVVDRMVQRDAQRLILTQGYAGMRRYVLENDGMHKRAEMLVNVIGDSDGTKHFEVLSEQGWKAAQKHVLHKMLESEAQMSPPEARAKTRLCSDNYEFQMTGRENVGDRPAYVIDVKPKRRDQYLFAGRIWVDAEDYALVRADGTPARNPSFWTKHVQFVHTYQKTGLFWFPLCTESVTDARIFGRTDLAIEYFDYKPNITVTAGAQAITTEGLGRHQ
jgi:negative regulator of sigma E activity